MSLLPKEYRLDIVADHLVARIRGHAALIDTGSPLTFRAPQIVSRQLGQSIRTLVGTDTLARRRVLLDWKGRRVVVGGPALAGERLPLVARAGIFQIEIETKNGPALAWLDSGAKLSYAPPAAVQGLTAVAHESDFYPLLGEFNVPVYELNVRVGSRRMRGRFGVLPPLLGAALAAFGPGGWILGSFWFKDRAIQLDFANLQVIDATVEMPRKRTTSRTTACGEDSPPIGGVASLDWQRGAQGIEGWRGWSLVDVDGRPRLKSLSAHAVWDGPNFTADVLPTVDRVGRRAGVHAYATPGQMRGLSYTSALVYGRVTLHGQVCVHEMGYRAEHCRIDRLYLSACGRHPGTLAHRKEPSMLYTYAPQAPAVYCACRDLAPDEWLNYDELVAVARELHLRYDCAVTIDCERPRVIGCARRHEADDAARVGSRKANTGPTLNARRRTATRGSYESATQTKGLLI